MTKTNKIILLISALVILMAIGRMSLAYDGKGYYWEMGSYLMIFNNLQINGYLAVENEVTQRAGKLGDLLIEDKMYLASDSDIYFCKNERDVTTNSPLNKGCANKIIIWDSAGIDVTDKSSLNQINATQIIAPTDIRLEVATGKMITANNPVRISGCFVNDGTESCNGGNLKTNNLYTDNLNHLNVCVGGSKAGIMCNNNTDCPGGICNAEIKLTPTNLILKELDLGPLDNLDKQNLCYKVSPGSSCTGVSLAGPDASWNYGSYPCSNPADGSCINGAKICCYLNVLNL